MKKITTLFLCLFLASCVSYKLVKTQSVNVKGINVTPTVAWNKSPWAPGKNVEVWTADGQSLNEVIFIGGIENGKTLFEARNKELPMPKFSSTMLANELETLTLSSFKNLYGGQIDLKSSNMRPHMIGDQMGFRFNLSYFTEDGLEKSGDVLVSVKDDRFYAVVFIAAKLHYYDKYQPSVDAMLNSVAI